MTSNVRRIDERDVDALEAFLVQHRDSSMFLRSNVRIGGFEYRGERHQGTYVARFEGAAITGVVGHAYNDMLMLQAPQHLGDLVRACVAESGRPVLGCTGPAAQVTEAREALGIREEHVLFEEAEELYGLELGAVRPPSSLESGSVVCRAPLPTEVDTLREWRHLFEVETLGAPHTAEHRERAARFVDDMVAEGRAWVAAAHEQPVSLAAVNAQLPDMVQLGSVYTPTFLRGRGFAKAAVAGLLLAARARGVTRAVLFTHNPSAARTYAAVGFERVGEFGLLLTREQSA